MFDPDTTDTLTQWIQHVKDVVLTYLTVHDSGMIALRKQQQIYIYIYISKSLYIYTH